MENQQDMLKAYRFKRTLARAEGITGPGVAYRIANGTVLPVEIDCTQPGRKERKFNAWIRREDLIKGAIQA